MRIRSIKPEFWSSEDIAALDWPTRLLFVGLWSYVDDNGVGRDVEKLIVADLFPLEDNPRDTLATVSRGLQQLSEAGLITRYSVRGKPYLHIVTWDEHQRIDRPAKSRYPLPTCDDAVSRDTLATPSRDLRESLATGTGEKGSRGFKDSCASADAERESEPPADDLAPRRDREREAEFETWWAAYPRKRAKGQAMKAYRAARRKVSADALLDTLKAQIPTLTSRGPEYVPYPATWLNGERWSDEADASRPTVEARRASGEWWA